MSLTKFLNIQGVRYRFKHEITRPQIDAAKRILAPVISANHTIVGTAFDYLLRFRLERVNRNCCISFPWIADFSPTALSRRLEPEMSRQTRLYLMEEIESARKLLSAARTEYNRYLSTGIASDEVLKSVIHLAQLDLVYRANWIGFGSVDSADIDDLRNLIKILDPEHFRSKDVCVLNPSFGYGSKIVGGADADIFIDGVLIDIKTTKDLKLTREHLNQLVGYFLLHEIGGLGELNPKRAIEKVGIYFSRYAYLVTWNIWDLINYRSYPAFISWFYDRADDWRRPNESPTKSGPENSFR